MQSSNEIVIINKPIGSFLQAGCPCCCPNNGVRAMNGKGFAAIKLYDGDGSDKSRYTTCLAQAKSSPPTCASCSELKSSLPQ